jgi:hypothetical protein
MSSHRDQTSVAHGLSACAANASQALSFARWFALASGRSETVR